MGPAGAVTAPDLRPVTISTMAPGRGRPLRLFVTGGSGYLGSELVTRSRRAGLATTAPPSGVVDLLDGRSVSEAIEAARPDVVVHTAYRSDRPSIVDATRHVVEATVAVEARLIHISSDVVFGGRSMPYTEGDHPDPVHDYGRWKYEAEALVAAGSFASLIVRTSLIYARSSMSPHDITVREAAMGRSQIEFFTDEIRSPVFVDDLAGALVRVARERDIDGVLHLAGPRQLSRSELADISCERFGWDASRLKTTTLAASGLVRPGRVVLESSRAGELGIVLDGPGRS